MRILWMIDSLGPGGAESLMVPLLKTLAHLLDEARVCVLTVRDGNPIAADLQKLCIPVDVLNIHNLRDGPGLLRVFNYVRRYGPDVLHTQLETSDITGTLSAALLRTPCVATMHTTEARPPGFRARARYWLRRRVLRCFSSRIIVVSESMHHHYVQLGFRESMLLTCYNGIDIERFGRSRTIVDAKRTVMRIPADSTLMTTVAVLREEKGIQYILQALPQLVAQIPGLHYAIVGAGPNMEPLRALSDSLSLSERVTFMGHRTDIARILEASDLFVYPTLNDVLPTALLEAMAAGVPIVASRVGGIPEILENEVTALLVGAADPSMLAGACLRLLKDGSLARRLSAAALDKVRERFDVRQQAGRLMAVYRSLARS